MNLYITFFKYIIQANIPIKDPLNVMRAWCIPTQGLAKLSLFLRA